MPQIITFGVTDASCPLFYPFVNAVSPFSLFEKFFHHIPKFGIYKLQQNAYGKYIDISVISLEKFLFKIQ